MSTAPAKSPSQVDTFSQQLTTTAVAASGWEECLGNVGSVFAQQPGWTAVVFYPAVRDASPQLMYADDGGAVVTLLEEELERTAEAARQGHGSVCCSSDQALGTQLIATSLPTWKTPGGVLLAIYEGTSTSSPGLLRPVELAAAALAHAQRSAQQTSGELTSPAARTVLPLVARLAHAESLAEAAKQVVNQLCEQLQCWQVGLAGCRRGRCRMLAVSGLAEVDRRAPLTQAYEAALEAAAAEESEITYAASVAPRPVEIAVEQLASAQGASHARMFPIRSRQGEIVAVCGLLADRPLNEDEDVNAVVESLTSWLGPLFQTRRDADLLARWNGGWRRVMGRRRWWFSALCVMAVLLFAIPMPYSVRCACEVQPAKRQLVVAPFDGTLANAFVEPGDVVTEGQVLARLDDRELRMELSSLEAELLREQKQRDTARAEQNVAAAQMAQLETQRIHHRVSLLEHRMQHLEVRSPVAGVIVGGDLGEVQGAPLETGEPLYEISPLQAMQVEVEIPEHQIPHVETTMPVQIALEAYPRRSWQGIVRTIHPKAELREQQNVFVAVVELANDGDLLRPGMRGRAKITSDRHVLAWNWFHRPWEVLLWKLGI